MKSQAKTYWLKLQEVHGFILTSGAVLDTLHLEPKSFNKLQKEIVPFTKNKIKGQKKNALTGAVTHYGILKIIKSKYGISL